MQSAETESTWFYDLLAWVDKNRKPVIAGGVTLLVLIVAGYVLNWKHQQTIRAANHALLAVSQRADSDQNPPAPADFLKIAEEYAGTSVADRALLLAAGRAYTDGNYTEAEKQFRAHLKKYPNSVFAPIASLGVAASLDAQDKVKEAIAAYEQTIATYSDDPAADRARLALATLYEDQNQPKEALRLYDQMTDNAGFSRMAFEATTRRQQLLAQHPELAPPPTNAVPAAVIAPAATNAPASATNTVASTNSASAPKTATEAPSTNAPAADKTR
jgi:predicted negative regulator of RcsB-dependent stress response